MCLPILLLVVLLNTSVYTTSAKPVESRGAAEIDKPFTLQCRNNSSTYDEHKDQAKNCNWTRNNKMILESNTNCVVEGFKLKIRRFIWKREQRFNCSCIPNLSYSFTITAERAPLVNVNTMQRHSRSERIHLNLTANPEPQILNWYRILYSGSVSEVDRTRSSYKLLPISGTSYQLQLDHVDVTEKDAGLYSVIISNVRGLYSYNYSIIIHGKYETNTGKLFFSRPLYIGALLALFCGVLSLMVGCCLIYRGLGKRAMSKYQVTYITGRAEDPEAIEDHPGSEWDSESLKAPRSAVSEGVTDDCIYELRDYELPLNVHNKTH
ncbi:uncharacterized protein LOC124144735 [Haliotis rufescens]|uniref:uncharacterized protein LOC124144735 n=1 Tax=Haliotis rufescens TaxID=6454 RepID=UPI00201F4233|nr:uncharacterized protein LOC124144735 [Haliotis rufescens]